MGLSVILVSFYTPPDFINVDIQLDYSSSTPLYKQIADRMMQLVATHKIGPGERLPSIRQLSQELNVNPNTVAKAYLLMEREHIVISRRGGGTSISPHETTQVLRNLRQKRLLESVHDDIVKNLSQGYTPEELEAAFYLSLERWREERQSTAEDGQEIVEPKDDNDVIRINGSHDLAFSILLDIFRQCENNVKTEVAHTGSLSGLIALQENKADIAGTHLLDEETGEYNYPYIKRILTGRKVAIVNLTYRIQGLMVASGNPLKIKSIADLQRPGIILANRQKGSGTRVLLDVELKRAGINPPQIEGYEVEFDTHLAVASQIVNGRANVCLGIEAAARSCNLDFIPIYKEQYDLVMFQENYRSRRISPMLKILDSDAYKKIVDEIGGYDTSQTGRTTFLN
jgi:molybdate-binding protein/DNA-binding transcriptional regulator YhcF (GntR family)